MGQTMHFMNTESPLTFDMPSQTLNYTYHFLEWDPKSSHPYAASHAISNKNVILTALNDHESLSQFGIATCGHAT